MSDMTIVQPARKSNPPVALNGADGRWLTSIGDITRECQDHGHDIDKRACRRLLQSGQLPGVQPPGSNRWWSHTTWLARHYARLFEQAS
ncbi:MAG: hypothetical protein ACR2RE_29270 [Geminicoccaceae bacterium]